MSIVTILEASPTQDLTTLATVKQELGLDAEDETPDAKLTRWISEASAACADYLGRVLGSERVAETFLSPRGTVLRLSRRPVIEVESVAVGGGFLPMEALVIDTTSALLFLASPRGNWACADVVVTYRAGYQLIGELPRSLEAATLILLRHRAASVSRDPMLKSEALPGAYEASYWISSDGMPPEVCALLDKHRDCAIA